MRLLGVELRRAFARRLTRLVILVAVAGIIAAGIAVYFHSNRTTGEAVPSGPKVQSFKDEAIAACVNGGPLEFPSPPEPLPSVGSAERAAACENLVDQLNFGQPNDHRFHLIQIPDVLRHISAFAAILAWLIGASLIGAEWRTGSMATLLTWEPRRIRVMIAKALAAVLATFIIVMFLQALLVAALYPAARFRGTTLGAGGHFWRSVSYLGLRSGALAAAAALLAFSVASIGRNTAAALGAGFAYLALIEGALLGALVASSRPWLLVRNAIVFISGDRTIASAITDSPGRTQTQAGLIVLAYAGGFFLLSLAVMRARDVN